VRDAVPSRIRIRHYATAAPGKLSPDYQRGHAQAFDNLVIATINGAPVRVRDIGRAEDGTREQRSAARLNGVPTVILEVRRQSGANTVAVIEGAKKSLALAQKELPPGIGLTVIQDQSR
jgi:HAE1 family hydrophobic/amphiphilic exporter-1